MSRSTLGATLLAAALGLGLGITALAPPAAVAAPPTTPCEEIAGLDKAPALADDVDVSGEPVAESPLADGTSIPVVMVHGWTGRSEHNADRTGAFSPVIDLVAAQDAGANFAESLIGAIQSTGGVSVYTFDYHDLSARWVTDDGIGAELAQALTCVAQAHERPAIVVAHSMGGLATRAALELIAHDPSLTRPEDFVSDVVTYGTPNTGSWLASLIGSVDEFATDVDQYSSEEYPNPLAPIQALLVLCGTRTTQSLDDDNGVCGLLSAQLASARSDAGQALEIGSPEIEALAPWPAAVQVHALAGSTTLETVGYEWFGHSSTLTSQNLGDVVVGTDSALDGATSTYSIECTTTVNFTGAVWTQIDRLGGLTEAPCFHGNLMRVVELAHQTMEVVAGVVTATGAEPDPRIPAELVGTWCTRDADENCLSFSELLDEYPEAWFADSWSDENTPDITRYQVCLAPDLGDTCSTAASMFFDYLAPGVEWDCVEQARAADWRTCSPDFTADHDPSEARVTRVPNHQHNTEFVDSPPMYRQ